MSIIVKILLNILITIIILTQLYFTNITFTENMLPLQLYKNIFMWVVPSIIIWSLWTYNVSESTQIISCKDNTSDNTTDISEQTPKVTIKRV